MPFGGEHPKMGTHNHLMRLGDQVFLEVISIADHIPSPGRPRWYGLDDPFVRQRIATEPTLLTWVVNTPDIEALTRQAAFSLGTPETISRGNLSWEFGLPEDGRLLAGGLLPYAIQWHGSTHPAANMTDLGCRLAKLELFHPCPEWLQTRLESIGARHCVEINPIEANAAPYILAHIKSSGGEIRLRSGETPRSA
jgi:hypothetical protein